MLCDNCQKEAATVHLSQILDDEVQKVDLCPTCAKEADVADEAGISLANMLAEAASGAETEALLAADAEAALSGDVEDDIDEDALLDEATCPTCGFTSDDFKKTGRLGCPTCYGTFDAMLGDVLKQTHKKTIHAGKVPARLARHRLAAEQLAGLRHQLDEAVRKEAFEDAAALRDQIALIEANLRDAS